MTSQVSSRLRTHSSSGLIANATGLRQRSGECAPECRIIMAWAIRNCQAIVNTLTGILSQTCYSGARWSVKPVVSLLHALAEESGIWENKCIT